MTRFARLAPVAALLLVACSSGDDDDAAPTAAAISTSATSMPASSAAPAGDPARVALDDVLGWLEDPSTVDASRLADTFVEPGVAVADGTFERVLFKGGSEPGVLVAGWLATRPDGSRIVVTGGVVDEAHRSIGRRSRCSASA